VVDCCLSRGELIWSIGFWVVWVVMCWWLGLVVGSLELIGVVLVRMM